jgi:hypothetical protein
MSTVINDILRRLDDARRKDNGTRALSGLLLALAILVGAGVVVLGIEALFWLSVTWRTVIVILGIVAATGVILWMAGIPLARRLGILHAETDLDTAGRVGRAYPEIHDRLLNVVQLAEQRASVSAYYSDELLDAALEDTRNEVASVDFASIVDRGPLRTFRRLLLAGVAVAALLALLLPRDLGQAAYRLMHFRQPFSPPAAFSLQVEPGNRDIVKGESVEVVVRVRGVTREPVEVLMRPDGQVTTDTYALGLQADGTYRYRLDAMRLSTSYRIRSGEVETEEYLLRVLDRPSIVTLQLRLTYPHYTGLPPKDLDENIGDVTAPAGTLLRLSLRSNKALMKATMRFSDSTQMALEATGTSVAGTLNLRNDRTYHLDIVDNEGLHNADPIEYAIRVIPDAPPAVSIVAPGMNLNVAGNERLPMVFRVTDDYGISRLRLAHKLIHSRYEQPARDFTNLDIPLPTGSGTEWLAPFAWELSALRLSPEDVVEYHAEALDNDAVSGPKRAMSETFTLRLPSLDEVFAEADKGHEVSARDLENTLKQAEEARKDLDELARQMKKEQQKLNWNEQKKAEELAKRYEEMRKKLDDVQRTVEKMAEEMQKNSILSPETVQKYQELQQLMEQISSPEFAEALKKLQQSMQQMNPAALRQALQQFQFSEEQFRKSIERTLNLLKRIQVEQKVDEMLKRAEAMEKAQEDLRKGLEKQPPTDRTSAEEAARAQQDLRDQAKTLERELAALEKKMEEFPAEMPVQQMQELQSSLQKSELDAAMQQSTEQIRQGEFQQAQQQQQKSSRALSSLKQGLQQMKQTMMQNQQRHVVQEMQRATRDLLELSKREEALKNEARDLDPSSQQFRDNAQQQMDALRDLGNVTGRLGGLSQKTFSITPEMGKSLGEAMRSMAQALESLEQRNGAQAAQQQGAAMGALNQTAQQLQEAVQGMMQGGGQGMGMAGFMQQLQRLSGSQQGINDATQGLTPQQAAEMARLAGEQGMVRKSLEELTREASRTGDMSKLLGDLNRIAQDMREVQTDLAQGNVNPETLHKQERILSRMLDAQRSMRERDYEKRRKSESGTDVARRNPGGLDPATQEGRSKLQRDLLRALEEGYNKDYEELIRKYFDALQK